MRATTLGSISDASTIARAPSVIINRRPSFIPPVVSYNFAELGNGLIEHLPKRKQSIEAHMLYRDQSIFQDN